MHNHPRTPIETDWKRAPSVLEGAKTLRLSPEGCDLDYWFEAVAGKMLRGVVRGHPPDCETPQYMKRPGPLRDAMIEEFSFRALAEERATRAIALLLPIAPDSLSLEFFITQIVDEARHASAFRGHLLDLGLSPDQVRSLLDELSLGPARAILDPLEEFARSVLAGPSAFLGGVVVLTILVEGVLAPAAELSERKWKLLDPAAAGIERGAAMDELRHLTVASEFVRRAVLKDPGWKPMLLDIVQRGFALWQRLPMKELLFRRESLFQSGMRDHAVALKGYEIWSDKLLLDSTPEERMGAAAAWSETTQRARLQYMELLTG